MSKELDVAIRAARAGGDILKKYFESPIDSEQKSDMSFVTKADKESEDAVRRMLSSIYPDVCFLGEECGFVEGTSDDRWVIDPLDGTANFMNAIPIFCVSLALMRNNSIEVAVVYNPITDTLFSAERGKGAQCDGAPMHVSSDEKKNVVVTFGKSAQQIDAEHVNTLFIAMQRAGFRVRYLGSAALELAYLARGGIDGYVNLGTNLWDYAAGALLLSEAGGTITKLDGSVWTNNERYFVASNGKIHGTIVERTKALK